MSKGAPNVPKYATSEDIERYERLMNGLRPNDREREAMKRVLAELRSHRRGAQALNQALNEGDGTYRP